MSGHFDDEMQPRRAEARSQGAQCWICPHCYDDAHHESGPDDCERKPAPPKLIQIGPTDV